VDVAPGAEPLPALVITGASGFLGRHLIAALRDRYRIIALARRSQQAVAVPRHRNVDWHQVDIGDEGPLTAVFRNLQGLAGPRYLIHLAAHYDFTGEPNPEYLRTNVEGLRNVLQLCRAFRPEHFFFASSVAACAFPPPGGALTESSPADGDHLYAITKRRGEAMVREYLAHFPSSIVRMGALFSDWCEYPPLYFFLRTWLSNALNRRILGGRGQSAIPYLHVRCAVGFYERLLGIHGQLEPGEVLIASTDGCVSHLETFEAAALAYGGHRIQPIFTPRLLARLGLRAIDFFGRFLAERPFERAWMGKYIDLRLTVDASRTRKRTGWSPNPRLFILRRMPFLVENLKMNPLEWNRRNLAALKTVRLEPNLHLYQLLEEHDEDILEASMTHFLDVEAGTLLPTYRGLAQDELRWAKQQLFLQLRNAVRTRERAIFRTYCRELAERRLRQGFSCEEVCRAFATERGIVLRALRGDPRSVPLEGAIHDFVVGTFLVGLDEIEDVYEQLSSGREEPSQEGGEGGKTGK
jgi:nucleoside-diphosphate-sugar epimerase